MTDRTRNAEKLGSAGLVAAAVVGTALISALVVYLRGGDVADYLVSGLVVAALWIVGLLSHRYEGVRRAVDVSFRKYLVFLLWMLLLFGPAVGARWVAGKILEQASLVVQGTLLVFWGVLLVAIIRLIATHRRRERLFEALERVGRFAPWAYFFNVLLLSLLFFGTVSYVLAQAGMLVFTDAAGRELRGGALVAGQVLDFYLWQFTDAIPVLKINQTLRWEEPVTYRGGWVGALVLLFKAVVIVPVIAGFRGYWKHRHPAL